jgi:cytochrome P450
VCIAWTGHLLAQHPEAQERLHAEATAAVAGDVPTLEELEALPFARRVIQESLRLYPPAWGIGREAHGGSELGGRAVPKGAAVFVSPWAMHRDPRFWDAPERFDPDRFLPERSAGRPRYAWFPFGGGARRCIGDAFAMQELVMVLGALAKRFRLTPVPGRTVVPHPLFTLRPSPGVFVTRGLRPAGASA